MVFDGEALVDDKCLEELGWEGDLLIT